MVQKCCWIVLGMLFLPSLASAQNRNFFNNGVALYNPIIDVVNTGPRLIVTPTVSADRKYVTISGTHEVAQLVAIQNFPFSTGGFAGAVGNAAGAPANAQFAFDMNVSKPVEIIEDRGLVLSKVGMRRVAALE